MDTNLQSVVIAHSLRRRKYQAAWRVADQIAINALQFQPGTHQVIVTERPTIQDVRLYVTTDHNLFGMSIYTGQLYLVQKFFQQDQVSQRLFGATVAGRLEMVQFLLEHKADVNYDNTRAFSHAIAVATLPIVECLLQHGARIESHHIHNAIRRGRLDVIQCFHQHGATCSNHHFVLEAVRQGHFALVKYLLQLGSANALFDCPINISKHHHLVVVRYLVECGAVINGKVKIGSIVTWCKP